MSGRITLVSGADANYYPLLLEWIHSIKRFPESAGVDICILDAGLTAEQVENLRPYAARIVRPDWPVELPAQKTSGKEYLKSCVCRPFLPKIFPGYDTYMWMDSDTWVQNWSAVALFLQGAALYPGKMILTGAVDRAYKRQIRVKWLWKWPYRVTNFYFSNAQKPFGFKIARELLSHYLLSAGCFALAGNAPHWQAWQDLAVIAMRRGKLFPAEQLSLGVLLHVKGFAAEVLPAYTHWLCGQTLLKWDGNHSQFVEPYLPHAPIGILHMAGIDDMRADRSATRTLETLSGGTIAKNYRYPHYDAGNLRTGSPDRA